jgi:hypothetical protein
MPTVKSRTDPNPPDLEVGDVVVAEMADDRFYLFFKDYYEHHGVRVMSRMIRGRVIVRRIEA